MYQKTKSSNALFRLYHMTVFVGPQINQDFSAEIQVLVMLAGLVVNGVSMSFYMMSGSGFA